MEDPAPLWAMIHEDDVAAMQQSVALSAETLSHWVHDWRIRTKSGKEKWLHGIGTPRRLNNGDIVWNSVIFDVTRERDTSMAISNTLSNIVHVLAATHEARDT